MKGIVVCGDACWKGAIISRNQLIMWFGKKSGEFEAIFLCMKEL